MSDMGDEGQGLPALSPADPADTALRRLIREHRHLRGLRGLTDHQSDVVGDRLTRLEAAIAATPAGGIAGCGVKIGLLHWLLQELGADPTQVALAGAAAQTLDRLTQGSAP